MQKDNGTQQDKEMQQDESIQIKIFSTSKGVNVIESPIKAKILSLLKNKELTGSEIVLLTGKSKSTISEHLKDLMDEGIIGARPHPQDRRKKLFFIKSRYLGDLSRKNEPTTGMEDYVYQRVYQNDPFEFFRFLFHTIRVALLDEGVNIDPILHNAGIKVGENFYKELKDPNIEKFIQNIAHFWEKHKLGRLEVESLEPLIINAYDCFECQDLPKIGKSACAFDSGILEAIFSAHFAAEMGVDEVKCYARGDENCSFVIKKLTD